MCFAPSDVWGSFGDPRESPIIGRVHKEADQENEYGRGQECVFLHFDLTGLLATAVTKIGVFVVALFKPSGLAEVIPDPFFCLFELVLPDFQVLVFLVRPSEDADLLVPDFPVGHDFVPTGVVDNRPELPVVI